MKCIKCGADTEDIRVGIDMGMWGAEEKKPGMAITQPNKIPFKACVCKECGYTEFYSYVEKQ